MQCKQGPLATPFFSAMSAPGEIQVFGLGGLTKVEALAGQLAVGLLRFCTIEEANSGEHDVLIGRRATELAKAVLEQVALQSDNAVT